MGQVGDGLALRLSSMTSRRRRRRRLWP